MSLWRWGVFCLQFTAVWNTLPDLFLCCVTEMMRSETEQVQIQHPCHQLLLRISLFEREKPKVNDVISKSRKNGTCIKIYAIIQLLLTRLPVHCY